MLIKNKQESDYLIKKLGLNRMLEGVFTRESSKELKAFLKEHPYPYYNIRDKSQAAGQFLYKLTADEIIEASKDYEKYSVYESLAEADSRLILQGEIQIDESFYLVASLSDIKNMPNRVAMQTPRHNIQVDLKEHREPSIRGFTEVIDYIVKHELLDMIVEFSLFEIPVGINKENIIIWELRNY